MQVDYIFCYKATVNLRNAYRSERELRSIVSLYAAISISIWENGLYPIYRAVSEDLLFYGVCGLFLCRILDLLFCNVLLFKCSVQTSMM